MPLPPTMAKLAETATGRQLISSSSSSSWENACWKHFILQLVFLHKKYTTEYKGTAKKSAFNEYPHPPTHSGEICACSLMQKWSLQFKIYLWIQIRQMSLLAYWNAFSVLNWHCTWLDVNQYPNWYTTLSFTYFSQQNYLGKGKCLHQVRFTFQRYNLHFPALFDILNP